MMLPHHEGALQECRRPSWQKGSNPELKALAQQIIDGQKREIDAMRAEVEKLGGDPAGGHSAHSG